MFENTKTMLLHTFFFLNLGVLNITKMFIFDNMTEMTIASNTLIGLVFIQFLGVCLVKIIKLSSTKWNNLCCRKNEMEEDWEPYMMAALQREKEQLESDEDKDSHSCESVESLPTYPVV